MSRRQTFYELHQAPSRMNPVESPNPSPRAPWPDQLIEAVTLFGGVMLLVLTVAALAVMTP